MSRKKIVAGNWKMYKTLPEAMETIGTLTHALAVQSPKENVEVWIAPPSVILPLIIHNYHNRGISFGAQNCSEHKEGAYTGEISAAMIRSVHAQFVILGHSERRAYHHENDTLIHKKIRAALSNQLIAVYCCGETLDQRNAGQHFDIVRKQVTEALSGFNADEMSNIVIAYEPVWAIGTGVTASPEQAQEMHALIRETLRQLFDGKVADQMHILYGGSVKPGNAAELFSQPDIDGGLVGGASLVASDFTGIIYAA